MSEQLLCVKCDEKVAEFPKSLPMTCRGCYEISGDLEDYIEDLQYHDDLTSVTGKFRVDEKDPGRY